MTDWSIPDLCDPSQNQNSVDVSGQDPNQMLSHLQMMLRIRAVERCMADGRRDLLIGGPVHLGVGQEAVAVGVSAALRRTDRVFGAHRSHAHVLALGASVHQLFAEVLGKDTGLSRGMGGSMHLLDQSHGFFGSVPIVSGTVPLAVGAGLAAKLQDSSDVGVAYLGDGAMEEGVVHESLNLASTLNIPVVFIVENNLFASHMHISQRQSANSTARFAAANNIPFEIIDGNDVVKVQSASTRLINAARSGKGPVFLEAVTYRWYGHVDWREDVDVGINRSLDDIDAWRKRDPITRLFSSLEANRILDSSSFSSMTTEIQSFVDEAWKQAQIDDYPPISALMSRVYVDPGAST